jgi:hypothetical protein
MEVRDLANCQSPINQSLVKVLYLQYANARDDSIINHSTALSSEKLNGRNVQLLLLSYVATCVRMVGQS